MKTVDINILRNNVEKNIIKTVKNIIFRQY